MGECETSLGLSRLGSSQCWRRSLAGSKLNQTDALNIAAKIGAKVEKDGAHQRAMLFHQDKLVLVFGIRHGKKGGHGHLEGENRDLKLNSARAVALARCTLSKEDYFEVLRERGVLPAEPERTPD